VNKFAHVRFEPSGFTGNSEIPIAKSIVDYIFRWLGSRFLSPDEKASLGLIDRSALVDDVPSGAIAAPVAVAPASTDTPVADARQSGGTSSSSSTEGGKVDENPPVHEALEPPPPAPAPHSSPEAEAASTGSTAVAEPVAEGREELAVIASTGKANGHAANGNGKSVGNSSGITLNLGGTKVAFAAQADAPSCAECGSIMVRNGSCYKCLNCGSTSGCS
jgi:ribonucleoside-diphosphate reductase alpha chain